VTPPGRLVFTAGACPLDQDGAVVSPGDVAAQAQQVMANLAVALGAAGAVLTDVAKTTVYVASSSRTDLVTAWKVVRDAFGDHERRAHCWAWRSSAILASSSRSRR
jgi:enamine deaminase RidA (YjgF/YER057c/UK114 family)